LTTDELENHQSKKCSQQEYKQKCRMYSACLSPESFAINIYCTWQVFWLVPVYCLPIPPQAEQWLQCKHFPLKAE